ncbi:MAG: DNA recombination protein RmuC [Anaerotignaceae bacterium]
MTEYIILGGMFIILMFMILIYGESKKKNNGTAAVLERVEQIKKDIEEQQRYLRQEMAATTNQSIRGLGEILAENEKNSGEMQTEKIIALDRAITQKQDILQKSINSQLGQQEERFKTFALENEQKLDNIRVSVEKKLTYIQEDNNKKLDEMRKIVDEKLQKTLEERMTESFKTVNDRLEQVYKGLGEMQNLAVGVGDLKKVLSNVKSRGILGEIQLGAILEEILAPEQYAVNVATRKGSKNVVEFAVKIPTQDDKILYLPIDSKFPADTYASLRDAYDEGDKEAINKAVKSLIATIKSEAKDIRDKYIDPPNTTEFAIMFLPFEGLYAEVVNRGMVEVLQKEYKVNIAGPSTMAALLNSLQMGFRTFAIQKRSSEVWTVLGAVKTEFE